MKHPNENRNGYKKTAVGWLPDNWQLSTLECISSFITKGATPTTYGFQWNPQNKGIPFLRSECVSENGFEKSGLTFISDEANKILFRSEVVPGDILMTITGNVGRSIVFPSFHPRANINQHIARIRIISDKTFTYFVYNQLCLPFYKKYYKKILTGQAYPQISLKQVRETPIIIPPIIEQEAINKIIYCWEKATKLSKDLIASKLILKKGLIQQLLTGNMRYPIFGEPVKQKGELPTGWIQEKLGACFKERSQSDSALPLLSITSERGVIPRDEVERKDTSNEDKSKHKKIIPGDIGYNTMRMWQGVSAVSGLEGIISPAYTVCSPKQGMVSDYFGYLFKSASMINRFHRQSQGLVDDTLNLKFHHFAQIKVNVPKKKEQFYIANVLKTVDKEISILEKELSSFKKQLKELKHKLLTGIIRHPDFIDYHNIFPKEK